MIVLLQAALIDESDVSLWWRIGDIALKVTNLKLARYSFEKVRILQHFSRFKMILNTN